MPMITQTYVLDLVPNGAPLVVYVSQYDKGSRTLAFTLHENGRLFTLPTGASVSLRGTKPDKTGFTYSYVSSSGNTVSFTLRDQMTTVAGPTICEIIITDSSGNKLGTANFVLYVEAAALNSDDVISETDIPIFEELVTQANTAAAEAQASAANARAAAEGVADVTDQVATNTTNISTLTTNLGNATTNITNLQGLVNGWKIYAPDAFSTETDLATVVESMQNRSMWFHNVNATTEFGGVPSVGLLGVIRVNVARNMLFLKYVTAGNPNGKLYVTSYGQNSQAIADWKEVLFADNIIGNNLTGFMAAINSNGNPYLRWIGPNSHYYQVLWYTENGTFSYQEYENGTWQTIMYPMEQPSLKGTRCLLIGNSFALGTKGNLTKWTDISGSPNAGRGWPYYFYQRTGCNPKVIEQSGGDFVSTGNGNADYTGMTFLQALTAYTNTITEAQRNAFKYIIVGGGFNDFNLDAVTEANIVTAINNFVSYCKTNYPNARIWIIPLMQEAGYLKTSFYAKVRAWVNTPALNGVCGSPVSADWFLNTSGFSDSDKIHLNDAGYQRAGAYIAALVQGWDGRFFLNETPVHVLYSASGVTITRIGTEVTCVFQACTSLPAASAITAAAGGIPWEPKVPNAQYFQLWDYSNGQDVWVQVNANGFGNLRTPAKEAVTGYSLYGTIKWNSNY